MADKQKVTVNLTGDAIQAVRELADKRGISIGEALRQAIATEKFLSDETSKGSKVLIDRPNQPTREVVIR